MKISKTMSEEVCTDLGNAVVVLDVIAARVQSMSDACQPGETLQFIKLEMFSRDTSIACTYGARDHDRTTCTESHEVQVPYVRIIAKVAMNDKEVGKTNE